MIDIEEAIAKLQALHRQMDNCEVEDYLEYAIETLIQKQWMIDRYEHEIDLLEQDLNDRSGMPTVTDVVIPMAKKAIYERVLADLKGDGEE